MDFHNEHGNPLSVLPAHGPSSGMTGVVPDVHAVNKNRKDGFTCQVCGDPTASAPLTGSANVQ